jgi:hypothetical protein
MVPGEGVVKKQQRGPGREAAFAGATRVDAAAPLGFRVADIGDQAGRGRSRSIEVVRLEREFEGWTQAREMTPGQAVPAPD